MTDQVQLLGNIKVPVPCFSGVNKLAKSHPAACKIAGLASIAMMTSYALTGLTSNIVALSSAAILANTVASTFLPHFMGLRNIPILNENQSFSPSNEELALRLPEAGYVCKFVDYREPNEGTPKNVKPHLAKMEKGWIVSTGTERSFFDLLLSPVDRCEGLIIRDINPNVKKYCDTLTLLLAISNSLEEFIDLSAKSKEFSEDKQQRIREKIQQSPYLSDQMKAYHLEHFVENGRHYLDCEHLPSIDNWKERRSPIGDNEGVDYRSDRCLFDKLQQYARKGRIIATVGTIDDLTFAGDRKISVIDVSNIPDYVCLNFQGNGPNFNPRIIHNQKPPHPVTTYHSYKHKPLDSKLQGDIKDRLTRLQAVWQRSGKEFNDTVVDLVQTKLREEQWVAMEKYYQSFGKLTKFIYGKTRRVSSRILESSFAQDVYNTPIPNVYSEELYHHLDDYFHLRTPDRVQKEYPLRKLSCSDYWDSTGARLPRPLP